jgi:hypothetical protein
LGDDMSRIVLSAITSLALIGCASAPAPSRALDGYRRIAIPPGCYGHESDRNVQLASELEARLLGLLQDRGSGVHCWHERENGSLLLTIDDECGPHREVEFQRLAGNWALASERDVPLVICDARAR